MPPRTASSAATAWPLAVALAAAGCGGGSSAPDIADAGLGLDGSRADAAPRADAPLAGDAHLDAPDAPDAPPSPVTIVDPDPTGSAATLFADGSADPAGPFFTSLGTNGRSCSTCHDRTAAWTVTPAALQARFDATDGTDPIFRPIDGATSPTADVSTVAARRTAYAVLLAKGDLRIDLAVPASAEFTVTAIDDPYAYATSTRLSLFRRILPATNLPFEVTTMWDGREPSLLSQATDATTGHAQAASANPAQMAAIVAFESTLYTAQITDSIAGALTDGSATGGPATLATQAFHAGINDPSDPDFTPDVFTQFTAWATLTGSDAQTLQRLSIARGETLFDTRTFAIAGVPGIADSAAATCSTCHDTPGTGGHSVDETMSLALDSSNRRTADLPLYTLTRTSDGTTQQTTDPGRAMITGKWADIGKVKIPALRGLAARAPYFHNGFSPTLSDLVSFYNDKFSIHLSTQDQADLIAFLDAL